MKILIADDDPQFLRALGITLHAHGYEVVSAADGAEAVRRAVEERPDLIIVDLGMPRLTGFSVIEAVRGWSTTPILVVSGRTESADTVQALDLGADDYVAKPFRTDELLARVRALLRRGGADPAQPEVMIGEHRVDLGAKQVRDASGATIRLTPTEWKVLELLVRSPDRLVTREQILEKVWGPHHGQDSGYLRLYISQLRRKLEADSAHPRHLLTEAGMGYRFVPRPEGEGSQEFTQG